ncbi:MAG: class II fructose-bisphosphate aldolase, partial [Flavobacteriales bacterium]|nr:class II fructose-bisphosphate aldolase [Flavobacteriales bacterium]
MLKNNFLYGTQNQQIYKLAKKKKFALPAINVSGTNTINSVLETASELNSPVIIQFSSGGSQFIAGKGMPNNGFNSSISGSIAGAYHIHKVIDEYNSKVVIHTDHCSKKLLPWIDGLLEYGKDFYKKNGYPLFSSHMIDLSEEPIEE